MAAKRYQDLVVWQAADEVRREVYRLTGHGAAARDFRFRDQARAAAAGATANISEGFRRYSSREFAQFLDYAFASSGETEHWLDDGVARRYWTEEDVRTARSQLRRLDTGLRALIHYLRSPKAVERVRRGSVSE